MHSLSLHCRITMRWQRWGHLHAAVLWVLHGVHVCSSRQPYVPTNVSVHSSHLAQQFSRYLCLTACIGGNGPPANSQQQQPTPPGWPQPMPQLWGHPASSEHMPSSSFMPSGGLPHSARSPFTMPGTSGPPWPTGEAPPPCCTCGCGAPGHCLQRTAGFCSVCTSMLALIPSVLWDWWQNVWRRSADQKQKLRLAPKVRNLKPCVSVWAQYCWHTLTTFDLMLQIHQLAQSSSRGSSRPHRLQVGVQMLLARVARPSRSRSEGRWPSTNTSRSAR